MNKEFKELSEKNEEIRKEIGLCLNRNMKTRQERDSMIDLIAELIDNEIKQESYCNE